MQIFDFTNGTKGKLLGTTKVMGYSSGCLSEGVSGKVYRISVARSFGPSTALNWTTGAGYTKRNGDDAAFKPEDFGVGAICFCAGDWGIGFGETCWEWYVVGTQAWNRQALADGLIQATFER